MAEFGTPVEVQLESTAGPVTTNSTFLICTLNRPQELRRALLSLMAQTVLPHELVIIDAGDGSAETELRELLRASGIRLVYERMDRGRTKQLNRGVRVASGDPVLIIDDDVELDPGFHEGMLRAFQEGGSDVVGVQGSIINDTSGSVWQRAFRTLFLLSRRTRDKPARLLPSGYYTTPAFPSQLREAEVLRLCGLAFRRRVFDDFAFDESLEGNALKEDIDFSYRVSRRHRLMITPHARFWHFKSPTARMSTRERARMRVIHNYQFFRKHVEGSPLRWMAYMWSTLGELISQVIRSLVRRDSSYVLGALEGLRTIVRGR